MSAAGEVAVVFRVCEVDVVVDRPPATRFALVGRHTYLGQRGEDEVLREVIETFAAYAHEFAREGKRRMVWFSHEYFVLSESLPLGALYDFIRCHEGGLGKCILLSDHGILFRPPFPIDLTCTNVAGKRKSSAMSATL